MRVSRRSAIAAAVGLLACLPTGSRKARARTLAAGPQDYRQLLGRLAPGDELRLAPGVYRGGLGLKGLWGTADDPIVLSGPADRSAQFLGRPEHNTVQLRDVSYLENRTPTQARKASVKEKVLRAGEVPVGRLQKKKKKK